MKNKLIIYTILILFLIAQSSVFANNIKNFIKNPFSIKNKNYIEGTIIKNNYFSITIPKELKDLYETDVAEDRISVYHQESKNSGFGGFTFGIKAYKNPSDHAVLPGGTKIGELMDKNGVLYDMVLKYPTDVQYDYTKSPKAPSDYKKLYDLGKVIDIKGVDGSTYFKNQGMKGDFLYKDILKKHQTAIIEQWDSEKLETENMSYMYNVISAETKNKKNVLKKIGYTYYDINADGIDELLIGEIANGSWKGIIYDIYTMVNREPRHVISGGSRNRYYVCDNSFVCNEYSGGAYESGVRVYILVENSTELFPQVSFKYDGYTNPKKPWFISYGVNQNTDEWDNVTEKTYEERKSVFETYERFNFISLKRIIK